MNSSSNHSKYLSMKFRYLFLKFIKSYKNNLQVGGAYKEPIDNNDLSRMETAAYAAVNKCLMTASADCSNAQDLYGEKVPCADDNTVLSIIASMFLSILNQDDTKNKNFLFELIIAILRKKLINCTQKKSTKKKEQQGLTQEKIIQIIEYFLEFIKLINKNLDNIKDNINKIFLNTEYCDSSRAATYLQKIEVDKKKSIFTQLGTSDENLNATTANEKHDLGIINVFFEKNISRIEKISLSTFIEYLKIDLVFNKIIKDHHSVITTELDDKLIVIKRNTFNKNVPGIENLIFIGTYNLLDSNVIKSFTKDAALEAGLQKIEINFLSDRQISNLEINPELNLNRADAYSDAINTQGNQEIEERNQRARQADKEAEQRAQDAKKAQEAQITQ
jgi:hypothetical protein